MQSAFGKRSLFILGLLIEVFSGTECSARNSKTDSLSVTKEFVPMAALGRSATVADRPGAAGHRILLGGYFRLVAAFQLNKGDDCNYHKQSSH